MTAEPFQDSAEHLQAELSLIDLLIGQEIVRTRSQAGREQDMFRGLYISDADVDRILANPEPIHSEKARTSFHTRIADVAAHLEARKQVTLKKGIPLSLPYVAHLFGLSFFEQRVLLMCAAPEMNRKYERLFGYLHDDISRRRPTVGLILDVLSPAEDRVEALKVFSPSAPLLRAGLIKFVTHADDTQLRRVLAIDEIVLNHLLGLGGPTAELQGCVRMFESRRTLEDLRWSPGLKKELTGFIGVRLQSGGVSEKRPILHLHGPHGTGKKTLAAALCRKTASIPLFVVELQELVRQSADLDNALCAVFRYALLLQAAVYLENFDCLLNDENKPVAWKQTLRRLIEEMSLVTFLGTEGPWKEGDSFGNLAFLSVNLPLPDASERNQIWAGLAMGCSVAENVVWEEIATQFRLTPGRMESAFDTAVLFASLREEQDKCINRTDLLRGCYLQSNRKLMTLAQRMVPRYTWSDIILPENVIAQLQEIYCQLKHRKLVYEDWGFERKLARGKGLCALFYGHSGVGKTMAVEVLAHELHLEIFKIDLSTVVSKYIGETEKNLSKIFQEAEDSNSILFFDEADALFGKRSEVKDAHDRYANIEINYLLQRMEDFSGLVVLATNLRRNIDEGFFRRMHFAVELPFPDETHRYRIWRQHFPQTAPLGGDIDFDFLAKRFALAGGHIRNVAVNAAFLAASNSGTIHMEHIIRATKREYEKIGKVCTDTEFAPYQWALRDVATKAQQSGRT